MHKKNPKSGKGKRELLKNYIRSARQFSENLQRSAEEISKLHKRTGLTGEHHGVA